MNINLSKFKKISENEKAAVMQHPDGHKITIAKGVLSPEMHAEIKKIPLHAAHGAMVQKFAEGDEVASHDPSIEPDYKSTQTADASPSIPPQQQAPSVVINNTPAPQAPAQPVQPMPQPAQAQDPRFNPVIPAMPSSVPSMPQNDPYGANAYANVSKEGLQNQVSGINEAAKAQGDINQAQAKVYDQGIPKQQEQINQYTQHVNNLHQEYQNFIQDYQDQHIDPNHYLNSIGTGSKISKGIGLILGGIASGGKNNSALGILHDQIQNDIKAQQSEMDKKNNLLAANFRQFGNIRDAAQMTEVMQKGIIGNQLEQAALKSGNPLLIARAKQTIGQLEQEKAQTFSQIAVRQSLQNSMNGSATSQNTQNAGTPEPEKVIRMYQMSGQMTPEQSNEANKQLQTAKNMMSAKQNLLTAFGEVDENNTLLNRVAHFGFTPPKTAAARDPLLAQLVKDSEGRITPADIALIEPLFPGPGDSQSTVEFKKRKMMDFIDQKMHFPLLESYGINPKATDRFDARGNTKVTEAAPILPK